MAHAMMTRRQKRRLSHRNKYDRQHLAVKEPRGQRKPTTKELAATLADEVLPIPAGVVYTPNGVYHAGWAQFA